MKNNSMKKAVSQFMALSLIALCGTSSTVSAATADVLTEFQSPTKASQANIRYWLKGSYVDENQIAADMKAISDAGFSTVEVINKGGSEKDLAVYGWGTQEWQKASELIVREAAANGLSVDFTVGPTWPAAIPTLDVNDEAASQQLAYTVKELSAADFTDGTLTIPLEAGPESQTKQTFIAAVFGKLTGEQRTDNGTYFAPPSGAEQSVDFTVNLLDEASLTVVEPDENGNITLSVDEGNENSYVLFTFYSQGTGQTVSGSTAADAVCIDHYSQEGTNALLNYWEENILNDTLSQYFKENGGDLFEDSLELTINVVPWTKNLLSLFEEKRGYDLTKYLPIIINRFYSATNNALGDGGIDESLLTCYGFSDSSDKKIVEDFNELMDTLYQENHLQIVNDWAKEHGLNYRVQAYSGYDTGHYDSNQAASMVGTIEGESLAFMESHDGIDSFRILSGGMHMAGKQILSDEMGAVFFGTYSVTFDKLAQLINLNAAGGVNQYVLHGYPSSCEAETDTWPGYHPFGAVFGEPWDDRQPVWEHMNIISDYMARTQKLLQEGTAKVDVAVYRDEKNIKTKFFDEDCLTVNGYSYEFLSDDTLLTENAVAADGVLTPDSAAYKALVLYHEKILSLPMAEKLNELADQGLVIVIVGEAPCAGKYYTDEDESISSCMDSLLEKENVYRIDSADMLVETLQTASVKPAVSYEEPANVHSLHRQSENADYYWLFNDSENAVELSASYAGTGDAYLMDFWNGAVTKLDTEDGEERVRATVSLAAGEAAAVLVTTDAVDTTGVVPENPSEEISLKDSHWTLDVESYTAAAENSSETKITAISSAIDALVPFGQIEGLENVSGKAVYRTTCSVESLDGVSSAILSMNVGADTAAITGVSVNGTEASAVNQAKDSVDISGLLTEGENTIEISIATTLANAVNQTSDREYGLLDAALKINR